MVPFCAASMFMTLPGLSLYAAEAVDSTIDDALIKKYIQIYYNCSGKSAMML